MSVILIDLLLLHGSDLATLLPFLTELLGSAEAAQAVITEDLVLG